MTVTLISFIYPFLQVFLFNWANQKGMQWNRTIFKTQLYFFVYISSAEGQVAKSIVIAQRTGLSSLWTWQLGQKPWTCDTRCSHLIPSSLHPEVPTVHRSSCTRTAPRCLHGNHQVESQGRQRIASVLLCRSHLKGKVIHYEHYENKT